MKSRQARLALLGLALGVLLALVIAPQTRWLVRLQALTALRLYHPLPARNAPPPAHPVPYTTSARGDQARYEAVTASHPGDYALQYALPTIFYNRDETLAGLRALAARFPDRPALYANILRYETLDNVRLIRPKEEALLNPGLHLDYDRMRFNAPTDLAAFDQAAAAGEKLDPDNAYFPLMRAVGLFAAFRDAEGLAAVRRASRKPHWREYLAEDAEAHWRLHREAFADPGALARVSGFASLELPHLSQLRTLARLVLVKAVQEEQAGHRAEGLELREALMRAGDLMRVQSSDAIEALVAVAVCAIATGDPGGVIPPKNGPGLPPEQRARRRLDAYCAYVTRLGHPEAAARARAEEAAGQQVESIANLDTPARLDPIVQRFLRLTSLWSAGVAVLSNVLWLLLLGGLTARLARSRWARRAGEGAGPAPMTRGAAAKRGLLVAAALATGFLLAESLLHFFEPPDFFGGIVQAAGTLCLLLAIFALPPALAVRLLRHGFRPPRALPAWRGPLRAVGGALLLGACLYGLCALVGWQAGSLADMAEGKYWLLNQSGGGGDDEARQGAERWLSAAAVFAVPLLLLLALGIIALVQRAPFLAGLVRGFAAATLPAASLLLLVWGGLLLGTARQEAAVNAQVWHQIHDEGPYLAAQMGKPWPGPVH